MADNETLFQNYLWRVEIDGFAIAEYNECAEIKTTTEVIERKPGGSHWTKKEAGRSKAENITPKSFILERNIYLLSIRLSDHRDKSFLLINMR